MGERRKAREMAVQALFLVEFYPPAEKGRMVESFWSGREVSPSIKGFAQRVVEGVLAHRSEIDRMIEESTEHWSPERLAVVDRNILRIAVFELTHLKEEIPPKVAINEAIDIAKKYGTEESGAFVNGVLDRILREQVEKGRS